MSNINDRLSQMNLFPISKIKVIKNVLRIYKMAATLPWCRRIYYALNIHFAHQRILSIYANNKPLSIVFDKQLECVTSMID